MWDSAKFFSISLTEKVAIKEFKNHFISFSRIHISHDYLFLNLVVCSFITRIDKLLSSFNFRYPKLCNRLSCLLPISRGEDAILLGGHGWEKATFEHPMLNLGIPQPCHKTLLPLPQRVNGATIQGTIHSPAKRDDK